jgi:hypothetical protein
MRCRLILCFFALLLAAKGDTARLCAEPDDDLIKDTINWWNKDLQGSFKAGDKLAEVEKFMSGKYRDKASTLGDGTGIYYQYYLVDDYIQVRLILNRHRELLRPPLAFRKVPWLRGPLGFLRTDAEPPLKKEPGQK